MTKGFSSEPETTKLSSTQSSSHKRVAREFDLSENKRILLDLPAYSPELQPAERLWPLVDEAIANKTPKDLNKIEYYH